MAQDAPTTACSAGSSPASCRRRWSTRTSARSPSWTSARPRAATRSSSRARHAADLLEVDDEDLAAVRRRRAAPRAARARARSGPTASTSSTPAARRRGRPSSTSTSTSIPRYADDPLRLPWSPGPGTRTRSPPPARPWLDDARIDRRRSWAPSSGALDERPARAGGPARGPHDRRAAAEPLRRGPHRRAAGGGRRAGRGAAPRLLVRAEGRVVSGGVDVHLFDGLSVADGERLVGRAPGDRSTPSRTCPARRSSPRTRCA